MKKLVFTLSLLAAASLILASVVFAGSLSLTGTLTPGGATEPQIALITTPNCVGGLFSFTVLYASYQFTVDTTGSYTITEPGVDSAIYLYNGPFSPSNPDVNCYAASNTNPINLSVSLSAGTVYTIVVIEDSFAQDGMTYNLNISGPGSVTIFSPDCPYPLPSGSVVYSIPAGAPAFFAPSLDSQTGFNVPAGTWYVSEFTGDFAKVWIACQAQPVYVPANAVSH
ncbi:MAG: hypothetical protein U0670_11330 [Anaerolineae bacterium]